MSCVNRAVKPSEHVTAVMCDTCSERFFLRPGQLLEHQIEREHSGRMRTVHVIAEEDRT